jgi:predicted metal-dependent HD superfamily phosphohydrolase
VDPKLATAVAEMVMATKHGAKVETGDRGYMVDIDLAGFAEPWDEFMRKGANLREEYATQPDDEYYRGQVAFLRALRRRPHFYCTDYFRMRYEATAQDNLRRLFDLRIQQGFGGEQ